MTTTLALDSLTLLRTASPPSHILVIIFSFLLFPRRHSALTDLTVCAAPTTQAECPLMDTPDQQLAIATYTSTLHSNVLHYIATVTLHSNLTLHSHLHLNTT
ncbi:LOW QUALITY PROTEIN: hypothetical protein Ahia01_000420300 [Argonauta hians]